MIDTVIGKTFTVGELIDELSKFNRDLPVCDSGYVRFDTVKEMTWVDSNYPYDLPDTEFVMIM